MSRYRERSQGRRSPIEVAPPGARRTTNCPPAATISPFGVIATAVSVWGAAQRQASTAPFMQTRSEPATTRTTSPSIANARAPARPWVSERGWPSASRRRTRPSAARATIESVPVSATAERATPCSARHCALPSPSNAVSPLSVAATIHPERATARARTGVDVSANQTWLPPALYSTTPLVPPTNAFP